MSLRDLRRIKKMQQKVAAAALNISKDYLSKIECGERKPGRELITRMAALYCVTIETIFLAIDRTI
jgi:transcriptional regulator with XRE-family HTH domain